jgi:hypothetical protein
MENANAPETNPKRCRIHQTHPAPGLCRFFLAPLNGEQVQQLGSLIADNEHQGFSGKNYLHLAGRVFAPGNPRPSRARSLDHALLELQTALAKKGWEVVK